MAPDFRTALCFLGELDIDSLHPENDVSRLLVLGYSISLDGYGAGPRQSREEPLGVGGEKPARLARDHSHVHRDARRRRCPAGMASAKATHYIIAKS